MKTYKGKAWFGIYGGFCSIPVEVELYEEELRDHWESVPMKWNTLVGETEAKIKDVLFPKVDKNDIHFDWEKD